VHDIQVAITADSSALEVVAGLERVFQASLPKGSRKSNQAEMFVSCVGGFPEGKGFPSEPCLLRNADPSLSSCLRQALQKCCIPPVQGEEEGVLLIGCLNACLVFHPRHPFAHCLLFASRCASPLHIASLHRILFVFLCLFMAERNRFFAHCAAIRHGKTGYLFWGGSGAGKTTVSSLSPRDHVLSDDAPLLLEEKGTFLCAASPFCQLAPPVEPGKRQISKIPVGKNLFLFKSQAFRLVKRPSLHAFQEILRHHVHGFDWMNRTQRIRAFHFIFDYCRRVPAYDMYFTKDSIFWQAIVT
jgi:hypothetical protein